MSKRTVYACPDCGSLYVQATAWVFVNTGEDSGSEGPRDDYYCPDCCAEGRGGDKHRLCEFEATDPLMRCTRPHCGYGGKHRVNADEATLRRLLTEGKLI